MQISIPDLNPGEVYAGVVLINGALSHHVILLPGEFPGGVWADADAWAAQAGGALPTPAEQAVLFANVKSEFQPAWYWSSDERPDYPGYHWATQFDNCSQHAIQSDGIRARAVRRIAIS
jgi:hypothetical protein